MQKKSLNIELTVKMKHLLLISAVLFAVIGVEESTVRKRHPSSKKWKNDLDYSNDDDESIVDENWNGDLGKLGKSGKLHRLSKIGADVKESLPDKPYNGIWRTHGMDGGTNPKIPTSH